MCSKTGTARTAPRSSARAARLQPTGSGIRQLRRWHSNSSRPRLSTSTHAWCNRSYTTGVGQNNCRRKTCMGFPHFSTSTSIAKTLRTGSRRAHRLRTEGCMRVDLSALKSSVRSSLPGAPGRPDSLRQKQGFVGKFGRLSSALEGGLFMAYSLLSLTPADCSHCATRISLSARPR